jgi:phage gp45-like
MLDSESIRFIREEIKRQVNIILSGVTDGTATHSEGIGQLFPGMPTIQDRPIMQPFGLSSQAPDGTIQVTARQGDHIGNRLVLGHRDKNKPSVIKGEVKLYNAYGDVIYVSEGVIRTTTPKIVDEADDIRIGSEAAEENFVLGQVFKTFAQQLLTQLAAETHVSGLPGYPTSVPQNAAKYNNLKATPIDDDAILSDKIFGEKG